jgi:hypothetical protein
MMSTRLRSIDGLNVSVTGGTIMVSTESTKLVQQVPNNKFPMQTYRYQGSTGHPNLDIISALSDSDEENG